tara:strand:- start:1182 stop:1427 length:246 start_codon:yes stop_codon:yes gene_type:complete
MFFTVDEEFDESVITVLDTNGQYDEIVMFFSENGIYIVQYNESTEVESTIEISTEMWETMIEAYNRTSGTYITVGSTQPVK